MNRARRKEIHDIVSELEALKERVIAIKDEEQESKDNLPEALQEGAQAQVSDDAIDNLERAESEVDEAIKSFEAAISYLEEATA